MQLSNLRKILVVIAFSILLLQGCNSVKEDRSTTAPPADVPKTEPPFANAEPETYQTEIAVTMATVTERLFAVRKGDKWRIDAAYGDAKQTTSLRTDKEYVLSTASKIYAEYPTSHGFDERAGTIEEITRGMLNGRGTAVFEKIGTDGGVTRYRMWGEPGKNLISVISFDETAGIPVKMEIFKDGDESAAPDVTVQLIGFKTEVDETLLAIPTDFRRVSIAEMRKVLISAQ